MCVCVCREEGKGREGTWTWTYGRVGEGEGEGETILAADWFSSPSGKGKFNNRLCRWCLSTGNVSSHRHRRTCLTPSSPVRGPAGLTSP